MQNQTYLLVLLPFLLLILNDLGGQINESFTLEQEGN